LHLAKAFKGEAFPTGELGGGFGDDDARAVFLVELLESGGEIDVVTVDRITEPLTGANQSAYNRAAIDADA